MLINKAIETAAKAHDGQYDKGGEPYIYHPLRVMLYANGDENVKCAAVLHDVIEDTKINERELAEDVYKRQELYPVSHYRGLYSGILRPRKIYVHPHPLQYPHFPKPL